MKLTDIIDRTFPDNEGYRLTDIQKVELKNKTYILFLTFRKLENARNRCNSSDSKEKNTLRKFHSGRTILRIGNIAYARLFVIGSIWWNEGKPLAITPDYLSQYSFDHKIIGDDNLKLCDTSYFIDDDSMGMEYTDKNDQLATRYSKILCFELSTPLFQHKKTENVIPLSNFAPWWDNPIETNFIAFHSYEVYRYFFSSYGITDLNDRMLYPNQFNPNSTVQNSVFDPKESVEKEGKHLVCLRKSYDIKDTSILGNLAYYPAFKSCIRKMQNYLNNYSTFSFGSIEKLPVSKFKSMNVSAIKVRRKADGAEGLYVIQIHSCNGYIDHGYTPVVPIPKTIDPQKPGISTGGGGGSGGNTQGTTPVVNHEITTGMGSDTVDLSLFGLEHLLTPNSDITLGETLGIRVDESGGGAMFPLGTGDNTVYPPGPTPGANGPRPEPIKVERTNYFEFFPEIVKLVCDKIKEYPFLVEQSYINEDLSSCEKSTIVDVRKIKDIILVEGDPEWQLYLAEIKVSGPDHRDSYYYLFEKYSETHTSSRTWLYALSGFKQFKEDDFKRSIKEFLFEQKNSIPERMEPDNKFNHLQSKKIPEKENKEKNTYVSVEKDEALNKHIKKVTNRILKVYGLRLPEQLQIAGISNTSN